MKRVALLSIILLIIFGFTAPKKVKVIVTNPISIKRINETVEISVSDISKVLKCNDYKNLVVFDKAGIEVPSQLLFIPAKVILSLTLLS